MLGPSMNMQSLIRASKESQSILLRSLVFTLFMVEKHLSPSAAVMGRTSPMAASLQSSGNPPWMLVPLARSRSTWRAVKLLANMLRNKGHSCLHGSSWMMGSAPCAYCCMKLLSCSSPWVGVSVGSWSGTTFICYRVDTAPLTQGCTVDQLLWKWKALTKVVRPAAVASPLSEHSLSKLVIREGMMWRMVLVAAS